MFQVSNFLRWYDHHGRKLPWRGTRNPYRILVSEIMLQQTQVPRVLLFYQKWLRRFPNWKRLARAGNAEAIRAWAGLGYNRRALMLRDAAREVVRTGVPRSEDGWRRLKGVGPYTAAALAVFSLHDRVLPIDTNIRRAGGRLLLGRTFPQPRDDERIRRKAQKILLTDKRFFDVPQALFDLASTVCTKNPSCATCPLRRDCPATEKFLSGRVRLPKQMIAKAIESRHRNKPFPDRIYRGRILKIVREDGPIRTTNIGRKADPSFDPRQDAAWLRNMIARMEKDGLIATRRDRLFIPDGTA